MYSKTLSRIVIWRKPDNTYYYRIIKGHYFDYEIGHKNSYEHEIVLIIDNLEYRIRKISKKKENQRKGYKIYRKSINFVI